MTYLSPSSPRDVFLRQEQLRTHLSATFALGRTTSLPQLKQDLLGQELHLLQQRLPLLLLHQLQQHLLRQRSSISPGCSSNSPGCSSTYPCSSSPGCSSYSSPSCSSTSISPPGSSSTSASSYSSSPPGYGSVFPPGYRSTGTSSSPG